MKNHTIFIVAAFYVLVNVSAEAQHIYSFDKKITQELNFHRKSKSTILASSINDHYYMTFGNYKDTLRANINDVKENVTHYFIIENKDSLVLKYQKTSSRLRVKKMYEKYRYTITSSQSRKELEQLKLTIFDSVNRKISNHKLYIERTDKSEFHYYKLGTFDHLITIKGEVPFPFRVLNTVGFNQVSKIKYTLQEIEDINFKVEIPQ